MEKWVAYNASIVRFDNSWFQAIKGELGQECVYLPWFNTKNGIQFIVEGTFFIKKIILTERVIENFELYRVFPMYEVEYSDILRLREIEHNLKEAEIIVATVGDIVSIGYKGSLYHGINGLVVHVSGKSAICRMEVRSHFAFDIIPTRFLEVV